MNNADIPLEDIAGPSRTGRKSPPRYPSANGGPSTEAHPEQPLHYYQVPIAIPAAKPWYKRKCFWVPWAIFLALLVLGSIAAVIAVSLRRHDGSERGTVTESFSSPHASSTTAEVIVTSKTISGQASVITTTRTPEESQEIMTIVVTVTRSIEDKAPDDAVTFVTTQAQIDTEMVTVVEDSEVTTELVTVTITNEGREAEPTTTSMAPTTSSASSTPTESSTFLLSDHSSILVFDVSTGSSRHHRRTIVWQSDNNATLIARDSGSGWSSTYPIFDVSERARLGTPITGAVDDDGMAHVFYLNSENRISHLMQDNPGEWVAGEEINVQVSGGISAIFHRSYDDVGLFVLAYVDDENSLGIMTNTGPSRSQSWEVYKPVYFQNMGGRGAVDVDITSGIPKVSEDDDAPVEGDYTGILIAVERDNAVEIIECSSQAGQIVECFEIDDAFHRASTARNDRDEPIELSAHPARIVWTSLAGIDGAPNEVYGLLTLTGDTLQHHLYVPDMPVDDPEKGGVVILEKDMVSTTLRHNVGAIAMADDGSLLFRDGGHLGEMMMDGKAQSWKFGEMLDTKVIG